MKIERMEHITRAIVQARRDAVFLFGDNTVHSGFGGQALAMRGEPNACGIPTKKFPSSRPYAFFDDAEFGQNCAAIDAAIRLIPRDGRVIVIPAAGLGTGLARLHEKAPRTFQYLEARLAALEAE